MPARRAAPRVRRESGDPSTIRAFFLAPMIFGAGLPAVEGLPAIRATGAIKLANLSSRRVGADLLLEAELS